MRVLIVDDSVVFRSQIKAALEGLPSIEVVGTANNGKIALQKITQASVDLITLDMEMPEMDGLETIKELRKMRSNVQIIVFSSHTTRGSAAALEALSAGAQDFVAKPTGDDLSYETAAQRIKMELVPKIQQFMAPLLPQPAVVPSLAPLRELPPYLKRDIDTFYPQVMVIGASTGGPPALEKLLTHLSLPLRVPILIAQHMPPVFTASLATRLAHQTGIVAAEGIDGEEVKANRIYVAPGNFHMQLGRKMGKVIIQLTQAPPRNSVRPAVDVLFESAAEVYGSKTCAVVLTGMGEDGLLGAIAIKKAGGGVLIQDRESCVVFGMPGAIHAAKAFDFMGDLAQLNTKFKKLCV